MRGARGGSPRLERHSGPTLGQAALGGVGWPGAGACCRKLGIMNVAAMTVDSYSHELRYSCLFPRACVESPARLLKRIDTESTHQGWITIEKPRPWPPEPGLRAHEPRFRVCYGRPSHPLAAPLATKHPARLRASASVVPRNLRMVGLEYILSGEPLDQSADV